VVGASVRSTISNRGSRVGTVMAFGMRPSAPTATAAKRLPNGRSAAGLATTVNFGRASFHQSRAACGGGPTRDIVRRWPGSNVSSVIDLTSLFERVFSGVSWSAVPPLTPRSTSHRVGARPGHPINGHQPLARRRPYKSRSVGTWPFQIALAEGAELQSNLLHLGATADCYVPVNGADDSPWIISLVTSQ
jgi:hypothetical protein